MKSPETLSHSCLTYQLISRAPGGQAEGLGRGKIISQFAGLRQLIRVHEFFAKTTQINKQKE
jgi:hypothetical protein